MDKSKNIESKELLAALLRTARKFAQVEKRPFGLADGDELSTREIHTVQVIGEHGVMNVTAVGEHFGVTKGAASQMISRLVKKGFIDKSLSAHSNKEFEISLTGKGHEAFAEHKKFHGNEFRDLLNEFGALSNAEIESAFEVVSIFEKTVDRRLGEK